MFKIKFPEQLVGDEMEEVAKCLKNLDGMDTLKIKEEELTDVRTLKNMVKFDTKQRNTHHQGGTEAADSDDEKEKDEKSGMPNMAQCAQQ